MSDGEAHTVSVYNQHGCYSRELPGPWIRPWGIAVDTNDDIYVSSYDGIKVINNTGEIIRTINRHVKRFSSGLCFITVYNDHLLVSHYDGKLHQLTKSGYYVKKMNVFNLQIARGLAVIATEDLIIVDREGRIRSLYYTKSANFQP